MAQHKFNSLQLTKKVQLIQEVKKSKRKKSEIAAEFGLPKSILSTIMESKQKILDYMGDGIVSGNKF